jgi:thioredoxin reductase
LNKGIKIMFEVAIIGGGVAGLSAALQLGRTRRKTLVLDGGSPRNRHVSHSHGWLTRDGASPAELGALARQDIAAYPAVHYQQDSLAQVTGHNNAWELLTHKGAHYQAKRLVLALGIRDELLPIPGLQERLGQEVQFCPYCHAYEWQDQPLGSVSKSPHALMKAALLQDWTQDLTLWYQGDQLTPQEREALSQSGIKLREESVQSVTPGEAGLWIQTETERVWVKGLFTDPVAIHQSELVAQLGCALSPDGFVVVDPFQATSVPGVFAAGDMTTPMHALSVASASGTLAASAAHRSLVFDKT